MPPVFAVFCILLEFMWQHPLQDKLQQQQQKAAAAAAATAAAAAEISVPPAPFQGGVNAALHQIPCHNRSR